MKDVKEKRYFCDWFDSLNNVIIFLVIMFVMILSTKIVYELIMDKYGHELDSYNKSDYECIEKITENIIKERRLDFSVIPENIKYEVKTEGESNITINLYNNNNKAYAPAVNGFVTISVKDFKIVSKSIMTEKQYISITKSTMFFVSLLLSFGIIFVTLIVSLIIYWRSEINKEKIGRIY